MHNAAATRNASAEGAKLEPKFNAANKMRNLLSQLVHRYVFAKPAPQPNVGKLKDKDLIEDDFDPMEFSRGPNFATVLDASIKVDAYPVVKATVVQDSVEGYVGDSAAVRVVDSVDGSNGAQFKGSLSSYQVPEIVQQWYGAQSFIGFQACAIIAQHWLVDKCCTMPGEDAVRNGYVLNLINEDNPEVQRLLQEGQHDAGSVIARMNDLDEDYNIRDQLIQFWRGIGIFGIRVCLFDVESDDPRYYEKPFNLDGIKRGTYRGIRQVDPYWMMPVLESNETGDPTDLHFYEPSYWTISGKRYHRSHLVIGRGPEPADILKPAYLFGGIPLTQRIYERVYASERTANEGPMLAMTKRTSVLKTDIAKAEAQPRKFMSKVLKWVAMRDNYGVKTIGLDDEMNQLDTSLADLDSVIMTQYQLVSAIAQVPSTKLMGTSPKGFNATGEFESKSYHERLETIQSNYLSPLLNRHHMLLAWSEFGVDLPIRATWNRVDSFSATELADLNAKKAETAERLVNVGSVSPDEIRTGLKNDPLSGFGHLTDEAASTELEPGQAEGGAESSAVGAALPTEGASGDDNTMPLLAQLRDLVSGSESQADVVQKLQQLRQLLGGIEAEQPGQSTDVNAVLQQLANMLSTQSNDSVRTVTPSVAGGVKPSVKMFHDGNQAGLPDMGGAQYSHMNMPKIRFGRLNVVIENPKNSIRAGMTLDGNYWRTQMADHYGYIVGTVGADGDEVDAFVGDDPSSRQVYVINQVEPATGEFDEHKVMLGYPSEADAIAAYHANYQKGWRGFGSCVTFVLEDFYHWLKSADLTVVADSIDPGQKKVDVLK